MPRKRSGTTRKNVVPPVLTEVVDDSEEPIADILARQRAFGVLEVLQYVLERYLQDDTKGTTRDAKEQRIPSAAISAGAASSAAAAAAAAAATTFVVPYRTTADGDARVVRVTTNRARKRSAPSPTTTRLERRLLCPDPPAKRRRRRHGRSGNSGCTSGDGSQSKRARRI
jgi:hypothetical protein